jgi:hypothetical protein
VAIGPRETLGQLALPWPPSGPRETLVRLGLVGLAGLARLAYGPSPFPIFLYLFIN